MKTVIVRIAALCASLIPFATATAAEPAALQFSALEFNAPDVDDVKGARISLLYGDTDNVTGLDLPIFALSEANNLTGVSLPLFIGGNKVTGEFKGLAVGLINIHEGNDTGVNLGGLNLTNDVYGVTLGFVNISSGETLADISAVNVSESSTFQLAFFNKTKQIEGVQIGFLNCADNGFLPCFPIINFAKQ